MTAPPTELRCLILTPLADDRAALCDQIDAMAAQAVPIEPLALNAALDGGAGCLVMTEDVLVPAVMEALLAWAVSQPDWSAFPVLVLSRAPAQLPDPLIQLLATGEPTGLQVTLLTRPLRPEILANALRNALASRRKQYRLRDQIAELEQQKEQIRMLGLEVQHRAKNSLAKLTALLDQTWRNARDPAHFIGSFSQRVHAMARSLDLMSMAEWRGMGLMELLRMEARAAVGDQADARMICRGEDLVLTTKAALALHLVIHELTTNAVKYGAFCNAEGQVHVDWTHVASADGPQLRLVWQEQGGPPIETPPDGRGFGSKLIDHVLRFEAGGAARHSFPYTGARCEIDLPLQDAPEG
ncbi:MAG: sensor histidine kinase [Rhodothalassiaceae bacterium]